MTQHTTDRELLELAAKALYAKTTNRDFDGARPWNPLENDRDALRLSVALELSVKHPDGENAWCQSYDFDSREWTTIMQPYGGDRYAAARRAIVRAAAEIGRTMK